MKQKKRKNAELSNSAADTAVSVRKQSWKEWLESPETIEKMKMFIYVQSFLVAILVSIPMFPDFWVSILNSIL